MVITILLNGTTVKKQFKDSEILKTAVEQNLASGHDSSRSTYLCNCVLWYWYDGGDTDIGQVSRIIELIESFLTYNDKKYTFGKYPPLGISGANTEEVQMLRYMWALNLVEYMKAEGM